MNGTGGRVGPGEQEPAPWWSHAQPGAGRPDATEPLHVAARSEETAVLDGMPTEVLPGLPFDAQRAPEAGPPWASGPPQAPGPPQAMPYGVPQPRLEPAPGGSGGGGIYDPTGYGPEPSGPAPASAALAVRSPQQVPVYDLRTEGVAPGPPVGPGPYGGPPVQAGRRPGAVPVWAWLACAALVLAVTGVFVGEAVARSSIENRLAALAAGIELENDAGEAVDGAFTVELVDGGSALLTLLGGTFDHVRLTAPDQDVDGAAVATTFDLYGVPTGLDGPVERIDASLAIDAEGLLGVLTLDDLEMEEDLFELESVTTDGDAVHYSMSSSSDASYDFDLVLTPDGDAIEAQVQNAVFELWGIDLPIGDGETMSVDVCAGSGVDGEMDDISIEGDQVVFTWSVTGATPGQLDDVWGCV